MIWVDGRPVPCTSGSSLLNALLNAGLVVATACGGHGQCHLCMVRVHGSAPTPTAPERLALSAEQLTQGVRLSCQILVTAPLRVSLLPLGPSPSSPSATRLPPRHRRKTRSQR